MKRLSFLMVPFLLIIFNLDTQAKIYKWTDDQGVEHYSTTPPPKKSKGTKGSKNCKRHVELYSARYLAGQLGKSEAWVVSNYKINVWKKESSKGKGRVVGAMLPGSRALILKIGSEDYKVKSPLDRSAGWVNKIHVKRTLIQNIKTRRPCR